MAPSARHALIVKLIVLAGFLAVFVGGWHFGAPTWVLAIAAFCAVVVVGNLKPEKPAPPGPAGPHQTGMTDNGAGPATGAATGAAVAAAGESGGSGGGEGGS